jgi:hypothetical protein
MRARPDEGSATEAFLPLCYNCEKLYALHFGEYRLCYQRQYAASNAQNRNIGVQLRNAVDEEPADLSKETPEARRLGCCSPAPVQALRWLEGGRRLIRIGQAQRISGCTARHLRRREEYAPLTGTRQSRARKRAEVQGSLIHGHFA